MKGNAFAVEVSDNGQTVATLHTEAAALLNQIAVNEGQIASLLSQIASGDKEIAALRHETSHLRRRADRTRTKISAIQATQALRRDWGGPPAGP